jgi:uncharacterized protein (DUF2141 family)
MLTAALALVPLLAADARAADTGTLTVVATGFTSEQGVVLVQLANSEADYDSDDEAFRFAEAKAGGGRSSVTFEAVPYGEYAIKIFHDENENRKIDMGWRGPTERYGFSNDARGLFGPPAYDDAKFTFAVEELRIEIIVQ